MTEPRKHNQRHSFWAMLGAAILGAMIALIVVVVVAWMFGILFLGGDGNPRHSQGVMEGAPGPDNRITTMPARKP